MSKEYNADGKVVSLMAKTGSKESDGQDLNGQELALISMATCTSYLIAMCLNKPYLKGLS